MTGSPGLGEIDVLAGPLPHADDRKRFEGALSRVQGARDVRGIATVGKTHRVRLRYTDAVPFAERLRALKEFRLRVIAQSATIVQVLVDVSQQ
ncbi:MAG: hypothetical protein AUH85_00460 [Chloroflexi bacterium 13_1_40CM_4_68_4]|nr:MAG: hypothetical protein AUH85_00460 [Chloroflexi bacterium 13_1_40CM_4_68_4]